MGVDEQKNKKIYYTMGEVSEMFDVNPSLIRFWEHKFDILKPDKNKKGNRLFTPADVENLKLIYHLVKEDGMTLAGAQKRLKQNREGLRRDLDIVDRLQRIRAVLLEVRQELKGTDENVVEIFIDSPVVSEEQEAGVSPISRVLPEMEAELGSKDPKEVRVKANRKNVAAVDREEQEYLVNSGTSISSQSQELWPEDKYSKPKRIQPGKTGEETMISSSGTTEPVTRPEVESPSLGPGSFQVVEQTLF